MKVQVNYIWCWWAYLIFVFFGTPPYFLACKKYTKKVRKFTTKIASRQNSINFWLAYLVIWLAYLVFWLSYSIFCWCTWFFSWYFSWRAWFFGWCIWYFVCYILWINFHKTVPSVLSVEKGTPAWKKYTTAGCGGCNKYQVWTCRVDNFQISLHTLCGEIQK